MQNTTGVSILTPPSSWPAHLPPRRDLLSPGWPPTPPRWSTDPRHRQELPALWASPGRSPRAAASSAGAAPGRPACSMSTASWAPPSCASALALFGPLPERLSIVPTIGAGGVRLDLGEEDGILRLMAAWNDPAAAGARHARRPRRPRRRSRPPRPAARFLLHLKQSRRAVLMVDHANRRGALHGSAAARERGRPGDGAAAARSAGRRRRQRPLRDPFREDPAARRACFADAGRAADGDGAGAWRWDRPTGRVERFAALVRQGLSRRDVVRGARHRAQLVLPAQGRGPLARAAAAEGHVMSGAPSASARAEAFELPDTTDLDSVNAAQVALIRLVAQSQLGAARGAGHQPDAGASPPRHRHRHAVAGR